ncbi:Hcp family type VI secretion system effector [Scandinavium goeteborgense]|jgi:type VI secretion system Hcp family effector|uniref:Hcp family type VI secretion system effector n=1 Tax=Scandinavium goeteborgense TaxID=1851514 RepID=UPI000D7C9547
MANIIYATITGNKQGLISAGCSTLDSIGNKCQKGHEDQIFIFEFLNLMTRESNIQLHPIQIRKPIDKSTPLLALAMNQNERLNCEFVFYRMNSSGGLEIFFKIKLHEATLTEIRMFSPNSLTHNELQSDESISLKYQSISWEHVLAGTSSYSIWEDRVY